MYGRLALACGQPSIPRLLRKMDASDVTFWQAYEEVEGPIGSGSMMREAYEDEPTAEVDDVDDIEPIDDEDAQRQRENAIYAKMARMFPQEV